MKPFILLTILAAFSTTTQASTANVYATQLLDYSNKASCNSVAVATTPGALGCDFVDYNLDYANRTISTSPANGSRLSTIVTTGTNTFTKSLQGEAWLKLGFGSNKVVTGAGADLVIFSIGNGYSFGLQAYSTNNTLLSSFLYPVTTQAVDGNGNPLFLTLPDGSQLNVSATSINLLNQHKVAIADNVGIRYIKLFMGTNSKYNTNNNNPLFSLAGAFHTKNLAPVPLPLPMILFSSGLALLGWFGRKKTV